MQIPMMSKEDDTIRRSDNSRISPHSRVSGYRRIFSDLFLLISITLLIFGCSREKPEDRYLIRVRATTVTDVEFNQAVESAIDESLYEESAMDQTTLHDLRIRVLNQLIEELLITERAKDLDIKITKDELDRAEAAIRSDYPDDTFETTLLENAISLAAWRKQLSTHLLVKKVIDSELIKNVNITSDDIAAYYQAHYPDGISKDQDSEAINEKIVAHLRHQKAEQAYKDWIENLRQLYPVDVNQRQWEKLLDESTRTE